MRLLYVEPELDVARATHARWLSYRSVSWDLLHCTDLSEAHELVWERGPFDCLIARFADDDELVCEGSALATDRTLAKLESCAQVCKQLAPLPVIVFLDHGEQKSEWIRAGAADVVVCSQHPRRQMRAMRAAIERARRSVMGPSRTEPMLAATAAAQAGDELTATVGRVSSESVNDSLQSLSTRSPRTVLHVDPDAVFHRRTAAELLRSPEEWRVTSAANMESVEHQVREQDIHFVICETSLTDSEGVATVERLKRLLDCPLIVLSCHDDESTSIQCIQAGADEVVCKAELTLGELSDLLRCADTWHGRSEAPVNEPRSTPLRPFATTAHERRRSPRLELTRPIYVIPVLPDGSPDTRRQVEGITLDISKEGLAFTAMGSDPLLTRRLVVGVEDTTGTAHFATVEVRHMGEAAAMLRYGGQIIRDHRDLFRETNLVPQLDSLGRLSQGLPLSTLEAWEKLGVLQRYQYGRVSLCPECGGLPFLRRGCKACGGPELSRCRLIHHFACAHVDHADRFETDQGIACPKCRANHLIAGTDFEYLDGTYECVECRWTDTEEETFGQCLSCRETFPLHHAQEEDLIGFYVERLDPMAFIGTS